MTKIVEQVDFGNSGIRISPIIVGCMSFGNKKWQPWVEDDKEKIFSVLKYCYDHGLRTFDTADVYSNGASERLLGEFLKKYDIPRETVVIMTKIYFPIDDALEVIPMPPSEEIRLRTKNQRGLSRKHIFAGVKNSVKRLGTYIDVLQIHRLDDNTPMKEIMRNLNDIVQSGDVRYIGGSSMFATEFADLQAIADKYNWFQFINWQIKYNLLYREAEREALPYAKRHQLAVTAYSPNASGLLTRSLDETTTRKKCDRAQNMVCEEDKQIIGRVEAISKERGVSMATVSTAWVLSKGYMPIVGMSSIERVNEAIEASTIKLTEEEIRSLEENYRPKSMEPIFKV